MNQVCRMQRLAVGRSLAVPFGSTLPCTRRTRAFSAASRTGTKNPALRRVSVRSQQQTEQAQKPAAEKESKELDSAVLGIGEEEYDLSGSHLKFKEPSGMQKFVTSLKLLRARPWRRFKKGSVLVFKIGGEIGDEPAGLFDSNYSLRQLCTAIYNAALDPRVSGIYVTITPLAVGWAKVQELRRYLEFFKQSGKFSISYMYTGGEKEYFLATAFSEYYCAPSASFALRGLAVSGSFLRGVLEKAGVEPQVRRFGKYKSAGDQLNRKDMAEPQREQLTALLEDIFGTFTKGVAASVGKTPEEVKEMLDAGYVDVAQYAERGWLTGLKYEDEILDDLESRTDSKDGKLKKVTLRKYANVPSTTFVGPLNKKRIALIRASGAITGATPSGLTSSGITADRVIEQLRACGKDKSVAAVVLRVDSPGGEATASDLMWREIRKLSKKKPVVASMGDVAASGGFYMAMAAQKIVAEPLTLTGSIGVVTAKFNLSELYRRVGFSKEIISRGKYAELLQESRPFTEEEEALFDEGAKRAYEDFRNKAAESRGMKPEQMEEFAQGRVWTGRRALSVGLVDYLGGLSTAVRLAKQLAGIGPDEFIRIAESSASRKSPLAVLRGATTLASTTLEAAKVVAVCGALLRGKPSSELLGQAVLELASKTPQSELNRPKVLAIMTDFVDL